MKITVQEEERYVDGYLHENLKGLQEYVQKKWDGVMFIGGYEGDAKSTLANQMAAIVDETYCLDRCVFTPEQFRKAVLKAEPYQAVVYDEAQDVFESTNRSRKALMTKDLLTRVRRRRLFIFICAPDFWRINKYLFIQRSRAFIHVYAKATERGFFSFFNRERKHQLVIKGKRDENVHAVPPNFRGRFTNWWPFDEDEYDRKKERSESRPPSEKESKFDETKRRILDDGDLVAQKKADLLGVHRSTIFIWKREEESGE